MKISRNMQQQPVYFVPTSLWGLFVYDNRTVPLPKTNFFNDLQKKTLYIEEPKANWSKIDEVMTATKHYCLVSINACAFILNMLYISEKLQ